MPGGGAWGLRRNKGWRGTKGRSDGATEGTTAVIRPLRRPVPSSPRRRFDAYAASAETAPPGRLVPTAVQAGPRWGRGVYQKAASQTRLPGGVSAGGRGATPGRGGVAPEGPLGGGGGAGGPAEGEKAPPAAPAGAA